VKQVISCNTQEITLHWKC